LISGFRDKRAAATGNDSTAPMTIASATISIVTTAPSSRRGP